MSDTAPKMSPEVKNSPFTIRDIQIQVALDNLERSMLAIMGGDTIAKWVRANKQKITTIFCSLEEACIGFTDKKSAAEFVAALNKIYLNEKETIVKFATWVKPKNSSDYILIFRWD